MKNLETALLLAREEFSRRIPSVMAQKAGVAAGGDGRLVVPFYGREYVFPVKKGETVPADKEILILHYLVRAPGILPVGEKVSLKELPNGFIYNESFRKRVIRPLVSAFGGRPELLVTAGAKVGGKPVPCGDAAVELLALPRLPLVFMIWNGDDEFPADGNVLFDAAVSAYLSVEDCVVLAQMGVSALREALG
ncbi:MAG: DUF3786 domain-containing protein [Firmicutes bacterium]|nr:DUF3786 domain-containing protein [Bacillota bacterium]